MKFLLFIVGLIVLVESDVTYTSSSRNVPFIENVTGNLCKITTDVLCFSNSESIDEIELRRLAQKLIGRGKFIISEIKSLQPPVRNLRSLLQDDGREYILDVLFNNTITKASLKSISRNSYFKCAPLIYKKVWYMADDLEKRYFSATKEQVILTDEVFEGQINYIKSRLELLEHDLNPLIRTCQEHLEECKITNHFMADIEFVLETLLGRCRAIENYFLVALGSFNNAEYANELENALTTLIKDCDT